MWPAQGGLNCPEWRLSFEADSWNKRVYRTGTISMPKGRVDTSDPFSITKPATETTIGAKRLKTDCTDVFFLNERGEITEGALNNIVIRKALK